MKLTAARIPAVRTALLKKQGNVCAICQQPFTKKDVPCLDHCHKTGYVRGVLHRTCNGQEGRVLTKAIRGHAGVTGEDYIIGLGKYYDQFKTPQTPYIHPTHKTEDEKRLARNKKARVKSAQRRAVAMLGK